MYILKYMWYIMVYGIHTAEQKTCGTKNDEEMFQNKLYEYKMTKDILSIVIYQ